MRNWKGGKSDLKVGTQNDSTYESVLVFINKWAIHGLFFFVLSFLCS